MRGLKLDMDFAWLLFLMIALISFWAKFAESSEARTLKLNDKKIGKIFVSFGKSTILSFPAKPSKVVLGNKGAFTLDYIDSDLAIAALRPNSTSNLFVYVQGRRFAFDLISRTQTPDEIVIVRDQADGTLNPKVKGD